MSGRRERDESFDIQKGLPTQEATGRGDVALGSEGTERVQDTKDDPTEGTVPGPLAPEQAPKTPPRRSPA